MAAIAHSHTRLCAPLRKQFSTSGSRRRLTRRYFRNSVFSCYFLHFLPNQTQHLHTSLHFLFVKFFLPFLLTTSQNLGAIVLKVNRPIAAGETMSMTTSWKIVLNRKHPPIRNGLEPWLGSSTPSPGQMTFNPLSRHSLPHYPKPLCSRPSASSRSHPKPFTSSTGYKKRVFLTLTNHTS